MVIKRRANGLVNGLGETASYFTQPCFVNRCFIDIVCPNSGYGLSASIPENRMEIFTLVIMKLVGVMTVQFVQEFDNIGIGIGSAEGVPSTIEAKNKLVWLFGLFREGGNHSRCDGDKRTEDKERAGWNFSYPSMIPLSGSATPWLFSARHPCKGFGLFSSAIIPWIQPATQAPNCNLCIPTVHRYLCLT